MDGRSVLLRVLLVAAGLWGGMGTRAQPAPELPPPLPILPEAGQLPTVPVPSVTGEQTAPLPSPTLMPELEGAAPPIPLAHPDYTFQRPPQASVGPVPSQRGELAAGTVIALTVFREMTFQPYQAINTYLQVVNPVVDRHGKVVIPAGSTVWGLFEPVYEEVASEADWDGRQKRRFVGNRFVASRVTTPEGTYVLQGSTDLIRTRFDPSANLGQVALEGAGYGAAGGLALGILTGGVGLLPVLAGTLAGAATGTTNVDQVVALHPNAVVQLELAQPLIIQ